MKRRNKKMTITLSAMVIEYILFVAARHGCKLREN